MMLIDIFSAFDANNLTALSLIRVVWGLRAAVLYIVHLIYWVSGHRYITIFLGLKSISFSTVERRVGKRIGRFNLYVASLATMLVILNLVGMGPYIFRCTSHLVFSLRLGLPLWLALILSRWSKRTSGAIASLLPAGAPAGLNPFLVLIETVRILVRPLTLSVRLMANIRAGHIILGLVGNYIFRGNTIFVVMSLVIFQIFYTMFEFAICLIQAYIFCLLVVLYSNEHIS